MGLAPLISDIFRFRSCNRAPVQLERYGRFRPGPRAPKLSKYTLTRPETPSHAQTASKTWNCSRSAITCDGRGTGGIFYRLRASGSHDRCSQCGDPLGPHRSGRDCAGQAPWQCRGAHGNRPRRHVRRDSCDQGTLRGLRHCNERAPGASPDAAAAAAVHGTLIGLLPSQPLSTSTTTPISRPSLTASRRRAGSMWESGWPRRCSSCDREMVSTTTPPTSSRHRDREYGSRRLRRLRSTSS